ncbi:class GN sortase [Methylorubrum aminovorans]|nr:MULTISPECIES: class GN sortase [unclassified Methylobacterium]QIJ74227.1 class GN sortase [Methylobacterium sp. CLZ]QIJ79132.1 class GN sortase [Methylobacterium sp. NI91]
MSGIAKRDAVVRRPGRRGLEASPAPWPASWPAPWPALLLVAAGLVLLAQAAWIPAKAALAQELLERAFARSLAEGTGQRPWPWADTVPVARIVFPGLNERYVALAGSSGQALAFGPGHVEGTPEAGEPGIAVYAAHRDTQFRSLGQLAAGDPIEVVRRDGRTVRFRVTGRRVVRWDASGLDPDAPGRRLVLATCWPLDAVTPGPERLLVEAVAEP